MAFPNNRPKIPGMNVKTRVLVAMKKYGVPAHRDLVTAMVNEDRENDGELPYSTSSVGEACNQLVQEGSLRRVRAGVFSIGPIERD